MININGIGQISIGVGADISGLNSDFDAMVNSASQVGQRIADALGSGAAKGKGLEDQINNAADALDRLTASANSAAAQLAGIAADGGENIRAVSASFGELGTTVTSLGYSLLTIGTELSVISAGLIEVGTTALESAGRMEQIRIGFETFAGSVDLGDQKLQELYTLGKNSPFDVEKIVDTGRKLLAVGADAETVTPLIKAMMDTVAATGAGQAGLDALTRAFQRMDEEQNVTVRDLRNIAYQVPGALQIVADALDTSISGVFQKARQHMLDAAQVSEALLQGMQDKFGGFSGKMADTLLGQWQELKNNLYDASVTLGTALIPAFKNLEQAAFGVVDRIADLARKFSELSPATQNFITASGLAVVTISGLTVAVGGLVLGIGKTIEAWGAISAILPTIAEAFAGLAVAAEAALPILIAIGAALAGLAAYNAYQTIKSVTTELDSLTTAQEKGVQATQQQAQMISLLTTALQKYNDEAALAGKSTVALPKFDPNSAKPIEDYIKALEDAASKLPTVVGSVKEAVAAFNSFKSSGIVDISGTLATMVDKMSGISMGAKMVIKSQEDLDAAWVSAKQTLAEVTQAYNNHLAPASAVTRAQVAVNEAFKAANPTIKDQKDSLAALEKELQAAGARFENFNTIFQATKVAYNEGTISAGLYLEVYQKLQTAAAKVGQTFSDVQAEVLKLGQQFSSDQAKYEAAKQVFQDISDRFSAGEASGSQFAEALKKVQDAAKKVGDTFIDVNAEIKAFTDHAREQEISVTADIAAFGELIQRAQPTVESQLAIADAFKKVSSEMSGMGVNIQKIGQTYQLMSNSADPAIQTVIDKLVALMVQNGITVTSIKNGVPTTFDAKTGIVEYGRSAEVASDNLSHLITASDGTVIKLVEFDAAARKGTDSISKVATSTKQAGDAMGSTRANFVSATSIFDDTTRALNDLYNKSTTAANGGQKLADIFNNAKGGLHEFNLEIINGNVYLQDAVTGTYTLVDATDALKLKLKSLGQIAYDTASAVNTLAKAYDEASAASKSADLGSGFATFGLGQTNEIASILTTMKSMGALQSQVDAFANAMGLLGGQGSYFSKDYINGLLTNGSFGGNLPSGNGSTPTGNIAKSVQDTTAAFTSLTSATADLTTSTSKLTDSQIAQLTGDEKIQAILQKYGVMLDSTSASLGNLSANIAASAPGSTTTITHSNSGDAFLDSFLDKVNSLVGFFTDSASTGGMKNPGQTGLEQAIAEAYKELGAIPGGSGTNVATMQDVTNQFDASVKQFVAATHVLGADVSASGSTSQEAANNLSKLIGDINPNFNLTTGFGNRFFTDPSRLFAAPQVLPNPLSSGGSLGPQFDVQTGKWVDSADALGAHLSVAADSFQEATDKLNLLIQDLNPNYGNGGISGQNRFLTDPATILGGKTVQPGPVNVGGANTGHPGLLDAPSKSLQDMIDNLNNGLSATGGPGAPNVTAPNIGGDTYVVNVTGNNISSQQQANSLVDQVVNKLRQTAGQVR